jgi:hypothetical protein
VAGLFTGLVLVDERVEVPHIEMDSASCTNRGSSPFQINRRTDQVERPRYVAASGREYSRFVSNGCFITFR